MDLVRETMNIGNICRCTVPERFDRALQQVLENIDDPNTPPEQKRKLVIEFVFEPSNTREVGEVRCNIKTSLAGMEGVAGNFFISKPAKGPVRGYARDPKQDDLFAAEPTADTRPV